VRCTHCVFVTLTTILLDVDDAAGTFRWSICAFLCFMRGVIVFLLSHFSFCVTCCGTAGDDGGSCIDGRLTSAWNWCSKLHKKPYYYVFMFTGFQGFDGDWKEN
jgi:hypothetical protein